MAEQARVVAAEELGAVAREALARWQQAHPLATLDEIVAAVDVVLLPLRTQWIGELVATEAVAAAAQARCPECGGPLQARGSKPREVLVPGQPQPLRLERAERRCSSCGRSVFPLDDALGLLSGSLSPHLWEGLLRLASRLPFAQAVDELGFFWRVDVSDETARRLTERAGAAYVAVQEAEGARIRREWPEPPHGPAVQQLSLDGVLVHATDGEWVEVKTAVVGEVEQRRSRDGTMEAHARDLSYFSRAAEVEPFTADLLVEIERRGVQTAGVVVSVNDGALWIQGGLDQYRRDAVRILDFAHATEHLAAAASAVYGRDTVALHGWMDEQTTALKDQGPAPVLAAVRHLPLGEAADPTAARQLQEQTLGYFLARLDQVQYPALVAAGYPIGSGAVESAGKLVVQARLKGSGMRWSRANLNPLVALRTVGCSGRWAEAWLQIHQHLRQQEAPRRHTAWRRRHPPLAALPVPAPPDLGLLRSAAKHLRAGRPHPPRFKDGRPTADHPWRRSARRSHQAS